MTPVAFIFARGGSKGLPGKNIRLLAGKPLIAWSIEHARAVKRIGRVIVSTDSDEIAAVARDFGAEVPFKRPAELASDDSPEWLAWRHALTFLRESEGEMPEVMLSIPSTAPLRLPIDIENCLDEFYKGNVDAVITVTEAHRNPWFNMVKENIDGSVSLIIANGLDLTRRQDAPAIFDVTTVSYAVRSQHVMKENGIFSGRVRAVKVPVERSIDIDTPFDFELAEYMINRPRGR
jgi:CMP-N-acetylneuraminic acid synthetase